MSERQTLIVMAQAPPSLCWQAGSLASGTQWQLKSVLFTPSNLDYSICTCAPVPYWLGGFGNVTSPLQPQLSSSPGPLQGCSCPSIRPSKSAGSTFTDSTNQGQKTPYLIHGWLNPWTGTHRYEGPTVLFISWMVTHPGSGLPVRKHAFIQVLQRFSRLTQIHQQEEGEGRGQYRHDR